MSQQPTSVIDLAEECNPSTDPPSSTAGFPTSPTGGLVITPDPAKVAQLMERKNKAAMPLAKDEPVKFGEPSLDMTLPPMELPAPMKPSAPPKNERKLGPCKRKSKDTSSTGFHVVPRSVKRSATSAFSNIEETPETAQDVPFETTKKVVFEDADTIMEVVPTETTKKVVSEDADTIMEVVPTETTKKVVSEDADKGEDSETTKKVVSEDTDKEEVSETTKKVAFETNKEKDSSADEGSETEEGDSETTAEKPFVCEPCGNAFCQSKYLAMHVCL